MARQMAPWRPAGLFVAPMRVLVRAWLAAAVLFVIVYLIGIDSFSAGPVVFATIAAALIAISLSSATLNIILQYRAAEEVKHGYTTLPNKYQQVEELDPRTGRTIRAAGEPFLDDRVRSERIRIGFDLSEDSGIGPRPADLYKRWPWWGTVVWASGLVAILVIGVLRFAL